MSLDIFSFYFHNLKILQQPHRVTSPHWLHICLPSLLTEHYSAIHAIRIIFLHSPLLLLSIFILQVMDACFLIYSCFDTLLHFRSVRLFCGHSRDPNACAQETSSACAPTVPHHGAPPRKKGTDNTTRCWDQLVRVS